MLTRLLRGILMVGLVSLFTQVSAQDVHFSQYNASPLMLNPALAGMNTCDYRIYANFRLQWPTISNGYTYRTFAGGADMSVGKVTKYNSFAGIGLSFFSDQSGALNLSSNRVELSFAYHFMLNKSGTMQISSGLVGSFNYTSIDPSKATYDTWYDPATGLVDPSRGSETFGRTKIIYADAGLGVLYSAVVKNNTNFYFGFSLTHLNEPKTSFYPSGQNASIAGNERLHMKITLHGGAAIPMGSRMMFMPNYMVLVQGPAYQFNIGANLKTALGSSTKTSTTSILFGVQYRGLFDAIILNMRLDYKGFSGGLSYDVNISKLTPASKTIGAPEISLMYQGCYRKRPRPGHCPVLL